MRLQAVIGERVSSDHRVRVSLCLLCDIYVFVVLLIVCPAFVMH